MNPKLLDILAWPLCKGHLIYDPTALELICRIDKLAYPIRDQIPVMMVQEARHLSSTE